MNDLYYGLQKEAVFKMKLSHSHINDFLASTLSSQEMVGI